MGWLHPTAPAYSWEARSQIAVRFLADIQPHLLIKADAVRVVMEFEAVRREWKGRQLSTPDRILRLQGFKNRLQGGT